MPTVESLEGPHGTIPTFHSVSRTFFYFLILFVLIRTDSLAGN